MPTIDLEFPVETIDDRITMRGVLARTRVAAGVVAVTPREIPLIDSVHGYTVHFDANITDATRSIFENFRVRYEDVDRERQQERVGRRFGESQRADRHPPGPIDSLISEVIRTSEGRTRLAMAMVAPLRRPLDYQSIARRALIVEPLPDGALSTYDRAPEPIPFPDWVVEGVWAYEASTDRYIQIEAFETLIAMRVRVRHWRTSAIESLAPETLAKSWVLSPPPQEPVSRFERDLFD